MKLVFIVAEYWGYEGNSFEKFASIAEAEKYYNSVELAEYGPYKKSLLLLIAESNYRED